ncbi:single-stranded DNA-binding protein [Maridesulfovibrio hydrothermalis]|uniref:Single-stranded DNA-binding protein n=1 Tax=Maridesulfovibrio hydrothermalis AM13 = DSM 14728 TaxID=1121451 RepID=L0R7G8_9BACT|nr:single-stranded DNA-binding protein [Maridesulfovibrio hydrothermalis]CCO22162.1 Single-stranded DNA-binding protein [Maridesulfovibrio hydrothermalis AM13 = DSM 14728]
MAGSMNKVILIGRIGQDPKLSYTTSGQAVANLSIATDEGYKDRNSGQKVEKTEWHRVVAWRQTAEFIGKYLSKGRLVMVEGKLQTRKWQDQNGQDRYTTEIVANNVQGLDSRQNDGGGYQGQQQGQYNNQQGQQQGQYNQQQGQYNNQQPAQQPGQQPQQQQAQQGGGFGDDEDLGPAFPSEASGMDEVPF